MEFQNNPNLSAEKNEQIKKWKETLAQTDIKKALEEFGCVLTPDKLSKQHNGDPDQRIAPFSFGGEDFILIGRVSVIETSKFPTGLFWLIERKGNFYIDEDRVEGNSIAEVLEKISQLPPLNEERERKSRKHDQSA